MTLAPAIVASPELQHMTGYDLKDVFDMSVGHFWTTTQSYMYKTRTDLEREGWMGYKFMEQDGKPNRNEHSITKTGRGMTAPSPDTRIKTAEDLGWNEAWSKYNSDGTWTMLDELFRAAQVILRWLLQCYAIPMVLSRPFGDDHA